MTAALLAKSNEALTPLGDQLRMRFGGLFDTVFAPREQTAAAGFMARRYILA